MSSRGLRQNRVETGAAFQASGKGRLLTGEGGITPTPLWGLAWNVRTPDPVAPQLSGGAVPPSLSPPVLSLTDTQPSLVLWYIMHFSERCNSLPSPPNCSALPLLPPLPFFCAGELGHEPDIWGLSAVAGGWGHRGVMPGAG